jgi:hypothetical protein
MDPGRALLTQRRREILQGDYDEIDRLYEERSRIRKIITHHLTDDVEILLDDESDLYAQLVATVVTEDGIDQLRDEHPDVFESLRSDICD